MRKNLITKQHATLDTSCCHNMVNMTIFNNSIVLTTTNKQTNKQTNDIQQTDSTKVDSKLYCNYKTETLYCTIMVFIRQKPYQPSGQLVCPDHLCVVAH